MPEKNGDKPHRFINEKIVRQPMSKRQIARRILLTAFCGILFGVLAAVCFVVSKPLAERYLGPEAAEESSQITIPKDEPETTTAAVETTAAVSQPAQETEPVAEIVRSEMKNYQYSVDDLTTMYNSLRTVATEVGKGVVAVHSIQHQVDWFDNPIETTGQFAGVLIAKTKTEALILTPEEAIESADSIEVAFQDGTVVPGKIKQRDTVSNMAVVSIELSALSGDQVKKLTEVELGNSYSVKQGDMVIAVGGPAGIIHSTDYGFVSYVVKSVQAVDGIARIFYSDVSSSAQVGTFILNTNGQLIGWVTDQYDKEGECNMTTIASISDYKGVLQNLSNGMAAPYFGIRGQEVNSAMEESGLPQGIYVADCIADSPAYNAGIQPGDIITWIDGSKTNTMKDFQNQVESLKPGDKVNVAVQRNGKDSYKEIEYPVTIGSR
ncbi:MAG: PDZ domain-containing protein [Enterocloster asparagiformis]|nr:PDZ domain-containing protein [Enterocloster asparagiformis]